MKVDFSSVTPTRPPTRKEAGRYRAWIKYLSDSKLSKEQIYSRAASYAQQGAKVPID